MVRGMDVIMEKAWMIPMKAVYANPVANPL